MKQAFVLIFSYTTDKYALIYMLIINSAARILMQ